MLSKNVYFLPIGFLILFLVFNTVSSFSQVDVEIENRTILTYDQIRSGTRLLEVSHGLHVPIQDSPLMLAALIHSTDRIIRLVEGDTVLLIKIPKTPPRTVGAPIVALRLLIDGSDNGASNLDDFIFDASVISDQYAIDRQKDGPTKKKFSNIDLDLCCTNPEELSVTLTGGGYGDATLIFTTASATPEIILHE